MKTITDYLKESTRIKYVNEEVLASAPAALGGVLEFFTLGKHIPDDELEKEYADRGLVPASPFDLFEYDKEHGKILDEKSYIATHWKDSSDKWCFATFGRWSGERSVRVGRSGFDWSGFWWFSGVKAKPSSSDTLTFERAVEMVKEAGYKVIKEL